MKIPAYFDNKQLIKVINKQIQLCLKYRYFRSMFFVSMRAKINTVFEYFKFLYENSFLFKRNIKSMRYNTNEASVCFKNGSIIRIVPATDNARGYRAHNIVVDADITNREIIYCVIKPTITDLLMVPPKWIKTLFGTRPYIRKRFKKTKYNVRM